MREPDVLDLAAKEHRELQRALRRTIGGHGGDALSSVAADNVARLSSLIAHHEASDRLLLYPLVGRDGYGRRSLADRRAEQRSISDQLAKALRVPHDALDEMTAVLRGMNLTFVGHSDREEIEDFPHARRLSSRDERQELAELRLLLRRELAERLPTVSSATIRRDRQGSERIGPLQAAIVTAKEILVELDRSRVGVG